MRSGCASSAMTTRPLESRAHFFAAAAEAMRHLLIETPAANSPAVTAADFNEWMLKMSISPCQPTRTISWPSTTRWTNWLRAVRSRPQVVKLRFFVGMTAAESAEVLACPNAPSSNTGHTPRPGFTRKFRANFAFNRKERKEHIDRSLCDAFSQCCCLSESSVFGKISHHGFHRSHGWEAVVFLSVNSVRV